MAYEIPHRYEPQIEKLATAQHISTDEAFERIIEAGLQRLNASPESSSVSNTSLFGSVKGAGAHGSKEAIDHYLAELRSEW